MMLLCSVLPFASPPSAVVVSAERERGAWIVPARVNGVEGRFALALESAPVRITPAFASRAGVRGNTARVEVGSISVVRVRPSVGALPVLLRVDGILGLDALRSLRIGFDFLSDQVAFWEKGAPRERIKTWVRGRFPAHAARSVPLSESGGGFTIEALVAGKPLRLSLGTVTPNTSLRSGAFDPSTAVRIGKGETVSYVTGDTEESEIFATEGAVPPLAPLPLVVRRSGRDAAYGFAPDGTIGLGSLGSGRLVANLAGRQLILDAPSQEERLGRELSEFSGLPLRVDGKRLLLSQPLMADPPELLTALAGSEVLSIGDLGTADLLGLNAAAPVRRLEVVAGLVRALEQGYDLVVLVEGEKKLYQIRP